MIGFDCIIKYGGIKMMETKRQAFIDFCKTFFNQPDLKETVFEDVKIEGDGDYTITFTLRREFLRQMPREVSKLLEDFRWSQAYSSDHEPSEVKVDKTPK